MSVAALHQRYKFRSAVRRAGSDTRGHAYSGSDSASFAGDDGAGRSADVNDINAVACSLEVALLNDLPKRAEVAELVDAHV